MEVINSKLSSGERVTFIEKKKRKDGSEFWTEVGVTPQEHEGKRVNLSIKRDVSSIVGITETTETQNGLGQSFIHLAKTTSKVPGVRDPYTQEHEQRVGELAKEGGGKQ